MPFEINCITASVWKRHRSCSAPQWWQTELQELAYCSIAPWGVCFRVPQWTPTFSIRTGYSTKSNHASCVKKRLKDSEISGICLGKVEVATKYRRRTSKVPVQMKWVSTCIKVLYTQPCKEQKYMHTGQNKCLKRQQIHAVIISQYYSLRRHRNTCHTMRWRWFTFIHSTWATMNFIQKS